MEESPSGLAGPEYDTTSCQCAGDKDDKKERLYGGYKMIDINVHDDKQERLYGGYKMIDNDEGSCCCHSCQNRKGECRESWYRHGDKPVAAPSQVEEADHLFSSLQPLTNYQ